MVRKEEQQASTKPDDVSSYVLYRFVVRACGGRTTRRFSEFTGEMASSWTRGSASGLATMFDETISSRGQASLCMDGQGRFDRFDFRGLWTALATAALCSCLMKQHWVNEGTLTTGLCYGGVYRCNCR